MRQILRAALPEAQEKISWSMPTYWKGRNIIHFAASKKHLGLYPGGEATVFFADRLSDYDVSKGTIRLSYTKPLPKELIAEIAVWCYGQYAKYLLTFPYVLMMMGSKPQLETRQLVTVP